MIIEFNSNEKFLELQWVPKVSEREKRERERERTLWEKVIFLALP
jgi:hypothetical protein